jgi:hypothetical protein
MNKVLLFFGLILLVLFSCDKRGITKPEISVIADKTEIFNSQNDRTITLTFKLTGEKSYISNVKILLEYNSELGTFLGTGNAFYLYTDENGEAEAIFQISPSAIGIVDITSRLDAFKTVYCTNKIKIHIKPTIESFTALPDTIEANGMSMAVINLQLSKSDKLDNIKILFNSTIGSLSSNSIYTDSSGYAQITFISVNYPSQAIVNAKLEKCPEVSSNLTIRME